MELASTDTAPKITRWSHSATYYSCC